MTKSILLVDDEPLISNAVKRNLQCLGFRVRTARTVESAFEKSKRARFDLVVTEFNVRSRRQQHPRAGNGLNLVRKIREHANPISVLVYTAMSGTGYEQASMEAGADQFLSRANDLEELVSRIARAESRR